MSIETEREKKKEAHFRTDHAVEVGVALPKRLTSLKLKPVHQGPLKKGFQGLLASSA